MHTCVGVWVLRVVQVVVVLRFQCRVCDKAEEVVAEKAVCVREGTCVRDDEPGFIEPL